MIKFKRSFKTIFLATIFAKTTVNSTAIAKNFSIHGAIGRLSSKSTMPGSLKIESPMQIISLTVYYKINSTWSIGVCEQSIIHPNSLSDYKIKFQKIPERIETSLEAFNQSQECNNIFDQYLKSPKNTPYKKLALLRTKHLESDLKTLETHLKLNPKKQIIQYRNMCEEYLKMDENYKNDPQIVQDPKESLYREIVAERPEIDKKLASVRNAVLMQECGIKIVEILQIKSIDSKYSICDSTQAQLLATVYNRNNLSVSLGLGLAIIKILKTQSVRAEKKIEEKKSESILLSITEVSQHPGFSMIAQLSYKLQDRLSLSTRYTFLSTFDRSITSHNATLGISWDL